MEIDSAKKLMKYYGFASQSVEPMLVEYKDSVGIFTTLKTEYGHLSRYLNFEDEITFETFLKLYLFYRKNINDPKIGVKFDNYEILSPKVEFLYNDIVLNPSNLSTVKTMKEDKEDNIIEELIIDTTFEDNMKIIEIVINKINELEEQFIIDEEKLKDINNEYNETLKTYKEQMNDEIKNDLKINHFDKVSWDKRIKIIKNDIDESNFKNSLEAIVDIYEQLLNDKEHFDNLYSIQEYAEKNRVVKETIERFKEYNAEKEKTKNKLFKTKKDKQTFVEFLNDNPVVQNSIDKNNIVTNNQSDYESELIKLKNNSIDDLKILYEITKKEPQKIEEVTEHKEINTNDLNQYFNSLSKEDRNKILVLSSPIKELINFIINNKNDDILTNIYEEPKFYNKFKEMYNILSSIDNYALTRKYLKKLKLDSTDEFINSIINYVNNMNIPTITINKNTTIKFKSGVIMKNGYLNASIKDEYPINIKGDNNYYITTLNEDIEAYYAPYIVTLDNENNLMLRQNDNIITFNIHDFKIDDKINIVINNYMLKKQKKNNQNIVSFPLFSKKTYVTSKLEKR